MPETVFCVKLLPTNKEILMKRLCIKIAGESGSGLLSVGEMIIKSLHDLGFYVVADREYPSVIKGEPACFLINASTKPIYSLY